MIQHRPRQDTTPAFHYFLAICALLALAFVMAVFPMKDYDVFWHVKTGDLIRVSRSLPRHDLFTFTSPQAAWDITSWGSDVILSLVYHYAGQEAGLIIFKALVIMLVYGFLLATTRRQYQRSFLLLPGLWLFSLIIGKESFLERPQIFSYLFLAAYYFLVDYYRRADTKIDYRLLLLFPILMGIWSNLHPGFAVGYFFLFVFLIGETIKYIFRNFLYNKWGIERLLPGKKLFWLWVIFPLVILATAANPYGIKTLLAPLNLFGPAAPTEMILEWAAPTFAEEPIFFAAFSLYTLIFLGSLLWLDLSDLLIIGLFSSMALGARRFIVEYALISLPLVYYYLDKLIQKLKERKTTAINLSLSGLSQPLVAFFLVTGIILGLIIFGGGLRVQNNPDRYPQYACDFIIQNNLEGNLFNEYRWGGYLILRLYPRIKVFTDGRLLSRRVFKDYIDVSRVSPDWEQILEANDVKIALTSYWYETGERFLLNDALLDSPNWIRVFDDNKSLIFVRNLPEFQRLIDKYAPLYPQNHPPSFVPAYNPHQYTR